MVRAHNVVGLILYGLGLGLLVLAFTETHVKEAVNLAGQGFVLVIAAALVMSAGGQ